MFQVYPYKSPDWAATLLQKPERFVKIARLDTPIHEWHLNDLPTGVTVHIKRDDLTGAELSGSKVRCLQFFFEEALSSGCRHVVTGGGPQSGHCRAVSLVARALGLTPHVVIEGAVKTEDVRAVGNALLYRLTGSHIYMAPYENYDSFRRRVELMSSYISDKYQEKCYCIPVGGCKPNTIYGYLSAFEELMSQGIHEQFDDIVVAVATGGLCLGLALANYLTGSKLKVHAVTIALPKECLHENLDMILAELGVNDVKCEHILDIIEGYIGEKYGTATEQVLDFITSVSSSTGVLLDPYYTGKAAMGMVQELRKNPGRFKGKRILFYHSGGIFGLFNGEMNRVIHKATTANITFWPDAEKPPLQ